ncbi:MAG: transcriptional regulator [Coriobacteriia bacterium]|nr:transcriptional regulator [Coriobacteriia bacterium]
MAYAGLTQRQVAEELDTTVSNFNQKLLKRTFRDEEMDKIAEIIGAEYEARFVFPDGTRI